jgi:hypothetical protein
MSRSFGWLALSLILLSLRSAAAADPPALDANLEPLRPFLGRTLKGVFPESKPDKPMSDVVRWEAILNGKAIRVMHSINDGAYGGETIIRWDAEQKAITFYYFTTADFMTSGTMTIEGTSITAHETVKNNAQGITAVRSTSELLPDGKLHVKSEYEKDGKWTPGRDMTYEEAPDAEVKFK